MQLMEPFPYLKRKIARAAKAHAKKMVDFQIWLAGINGSLILIAALISALGYIEPRHLMIAGAFLIGLQIVLCWLLSAAYKFQEKIRLLSVVHPFLYIPIFAVPFLTLQYPPPLPPPVFSF
jgi:hypothetical protein